EPLRDRLRPRLRGALQEPALRRRTERGADPGRGLSKPVPAPWRTPIGCYSGPRNRVNRFFRSALFPLVVIVLLVYLASQTLIPHQKSAKKWTYAQLIDDVKKEPGAYDVVVFNPSKREAQASFKDDQRPKVKVNYPSDQSQIQFQTLLEKQ